MTSGRLQNCLETRTGFGLTAPIFIGVTISLSVVLVSFIMVSVFLIFRNKFLGKLYELEEDVELLITNEQEKRLIVEDLNRDLVRQNQRKLDLEGKLKLAQQQGVSLGMSKQKMFEEITSSDQGAVLAQANYQKVEQLKKELEQQRVDAQLRIQDQEKSIKILEDDLSIVEKNFEEKQKALCTTRVKLEIFERRETDFFAQFECSNVTKVGSIELLGTRLTVLNLRMEMLCTSRFISVFHAEWRLVSEIYVQSLMSFMAERIESTMAGFTGDPIKLSLLREVEKKLSRVNLWNNSLEKEIAFMRAQYQEACETNNELMKHNVEPRKEKERLKCELDKWISAYKSRYIRKENLSKSIEEEEELMRRQRASANANMKLLDRLTTLMEEEAEHAKSIKDLEEQVANLRPEHLEAKNDKLRKEIERCREIIDNQLLCIKNLEDRCTDARSYGRNLVDMERKLLAYRVEAANEALVLKFNLISYNKHNEILMDDNPYLASISEQFSSNEIKRLSSVNADLRKNIQLLLNRLGQYKNSMDKIRSMFTEKYVMTIVEKVERENSSRQIELLDGKISALDVLCCDLQDKCSKLNQRYRSQMISIRDLREHLFEIYECGASEPIYYIKIGFAERRKKLESLDNRNKSLRKQLYEVYKNTTEETERAETFEQSFISDKETILKFKELRDESSKMDMSIWQLKYMDARSTEQIEFSMVESGKYA